MGSGVLATFNRWCAGLIGESSSFGSPLGSGPLACIDSTFAVVSESGVAPRDGLDLSLCQSVDCDSRPRSGCPEQDSKGLVRATWPSEHDVKLLVRREASYRTLNCRWFWDSRLATAVLSPGEISLPPIFFFWDCRGRQSLKRG